VRVEFCEADVLDLFDDWKRAVGVRAATPAEDELPDADTGAARNRGTLPAHLDRLVSRLTLLRAGEERSLDATLDDIVREVDAARSGAKGLRGEAREALLERLRALDVKLLLAARGGCDVPTLQRLGMEADAQLAPFRDRMPTAVYAQSKQACLDRLIREHLRLPVIAFD
jgi:hypothetical protein